jgi:adenine phosphoribosyltransferase
MDLRRYIRDIPDFPKPGILFRDITPMLADGKALRWTIDQLSERYQGTVDMVLGIESRGFIIGAALAQRLGRPSSGLSGTDNDEGVAAAQGVSC